MIGTLTAKIWAKTGVIFLACMAMAVPLLWYYGSAVLMILRGETPSVTESRSLIFIMAGVGLLALLIGLLSVIALFANPVSEQVDSYLAQHPGVTIEQLDQDFASARQIGIMWLGERWTFSHELRDLVVENKEIVRVYAWEELRHGSANMYWFYLCMELAGGDTMKLKMDYHDLAQIIEWYGQYPDIMAENNLGI